MKALSITPFANQLERKRALKTGRRDNSYIFLVSIYSLLLFYGNRYRRSLVQAIRECLPFDAIFKKGCLPRPHYHSSVQNHFLVKTIRLVN